MNIKTNLNFEAIAINNNCGVASNYDRNGLFRVNIDSGECSFISLFEREHINGKRLHCSAEWIGDKIYFIPGAAKTISIYDIKKNTIETIHIPLPKKKQYLFYKPQYKFVGAVKNKKFLWLVPSTYPGVIRLNIINNDIKLFDDWVPEDGYMFRRGIHVENDRFIIPSGNNNYILVFDMSKESGQMLEMGKSNNGMMSMCKVGENYWFAPRKKGSIISWNPTLNVVNEYKDYPYSFESGEIVFSNVFGYNESIFFSPARANNGVVIKDGKMEIDKHIHWKSHSNSMVEFLFESSLNRYYREIYSNGHSRYFKISKIDNGESQFEFYYKATVDMDKKMLNKAISDKELLEENEIFNLQNYLRVLKERNV